MLGRALTVLHVLPFGAVGGTEVATRRIIDTSALLGVRSFAVLLDAADSLRQYLDSAGIAYRVASPVPHPSFRRGYSFLRDSSRLARMFDGSGADLVHCADILASYHVAVAGRLARIPVLCHVRNRYDDISRRDRFFIGFANHFAFVSQHTREHFVISVPDTRATVLYDGIDIVPEQQSAEAPEIARQVRNELGLAAGAALIVMVARIAPQKDYETLISAAAIVVQQYPEAVFIIVGDHSQTPERRAHFDHVRGLIAETGLNGHFVFTGHQPDNFRFQLAADICVLSTHWEGLPLVLLEAMAAARPVVATAVDGVPEAVTDGVTGWLCPHADAAALAGRLSALLADPALARRMGQAGREEVRRRFSRERFARDIGQLYAKVAGEWRDNILRADAG